MPTILILLPSLPQVSTILSSFLEHVSREKKLRQKYGSKISSYLISHWSSLASWWGKEVFIPDRRLAAINILKCMVSIDKKVQYFLNQSLELTDGY